MQLDHHIAQVHTQLGAAAALGDDRTREIAEALATAATPAVRLALLNAVSEAADEITAALLDHPGSPTVNARLDGTELAVDVTVTPPPEAPAEPRRDEGDPSARISLRLSEALKAEIDAAADRDGISVNTWLVRAASAALRTSLGAGGGFDAGSGWGSGWGGGWD
ncbi:MAG: toxin-antitoxin system HicB family antitoxin, partial [Actinobacteria bacterium]|nr:toxin-antitoxin system HicB family antitoxin [Actinomycetota bacterium]